MKLGHRVRRRLAAAAAVATVAIGVPVGALAASAPHTPAVGQCNNGNTLAWFADNGDGTAGAIFYPVEFTNIGHSSCTLFGYPGVSAVNSKGKQIGPAAKRLTAAKHTITLKPGQTASAQLGILPPGFVSGCKAATAAGFRIFPPNETGGQVAWNLSFPMCKNRSLLTVYPVTKGIGVP
jgi:hypothetical protein